MVNGAIEKQFQAIGVRPFVLKWWSDVEKVFFISRCYVKINGAIWTVVEIMWFQPLNGVWNVEILCNVQYMDWFQFAKARHVVVHIQNCYQNVFDTSGELCSAV
jgi:hypothetical protein